jgi:hypothetical protein
MYKFSIMINPSHETTAVFDEYFDEYEAEDFDVDESGNRRFYRHDATSGGTATHTARVYAAGYWLMLDYADDQETTESAESLEGIAESERA